MRAVATEVRAYEAATGKPLWSRQGFYSPTVVRPNFVVFAQDGQLQLFGRQWQNGIPHLRVDLRTGAMLPLRWAVDKPGVLLGARSLIGLGKQEAFIRIIDRSENKNGPARVYRYSLAKGTSQAIEGMDMIHMVSPPYVLVGGAASSLFNCDDPSWAYPLAGQGGPEFSVGLMLFAGNNKITFVDPASKKRLFELDLGKKPLGGLGFIKLDGARMLAYGVNESLMEFMEVDMTSGAVVREASLPRCDPAGREQLRGRPWLVNGLLIFSGEGGLQALAGAGE
jgi:hypothetical protein